MRMAEVRAQWPALPWGEWAGDGGYAAHVDADRGKDAAGADSAAEPLVECAAVCDGAGLGTSAMACGDDVLDIEFDFVAHVLHLRLGSGRRPDDAAAGRRRWRIFIRSIWIVWRRLGVSVKINPMPVEVAESDPVRSGYGAQVV